MNKKILNWLTPLNRILLGLVVFVPGILKLFVFTPSGVAGMLGGLGFPIAEFFAWVLILSEIIFGAFVIFNYKLKYTVFVPSFILLVAAFTAHINDIGRIIIHLALIANYFLVANTKK